MCENQHKSALGVELLLNDKRIDVNKSTNFNSTPLYSALRKVENKDDYFYNVAKILLGHKDIEVNATVFWNVSNDYSTHVQKRTQKCSWR